MSTVFQALLAAAGAALQAEPALAGRVYAERVAATTRDECPLVNLLPGEARFEPYGAEADGLSAGVLRGTVPLTLRVHTRGDPHTQLADPVIAQAHAALMADPSLGGLACRLRLVSSRPQLAEADATAGNWELDYEATVLIDERTLELLPA